MFPALSTATWEPGISRVGVAEPCAVRGKHQCGDRVPASLHHVKILLERGEVRATRGEVRATRGEVRATRGEGGRRGGKAGGAGGSAGGAEVVVPWAVVPPGEARDATWFAPHPARKSIPQEQIRKLQRKLISGT